MQGYYDEVIALAAGRPTSAVDPAVLDVLRLGAHQLLATRVPTHAAVYEQVALARRVAPKAAGFANAVLRTVSRSSLEAWRELVTEGAQGEDERLPGSRATRSGSCAPSGPPPARGARR